MSCQVLSPGVQECEGPVVDEVGEVVLSIVRPMLLRHPVNREGVVIVLGVANLGQGMVIISISAANRSIGSTTGCTITEKAPTSPL